MPMRQPLGIRTPGVFADVKKRRIAVGLNLAVGRLKGDQAAVMPSACQQAGVEAFDDEVDGVRREGAGGPGG